MLDSKMIDGEDTTLDELGPFEDNWQRVQCFAAILQMANEGKVCQFTRTLTSFIIFFSDIDQTWPIHNGPRSTSGGRHCTVSKG